MRWLALALAVANLVVGSYLLVLAPRPRGPAEIAALELNADRVRVVSEKAARTPITSAAQPPVGACLEWGVFMPPDLERAQAELDLAKIDKAAVRELDVPATWLVYIPQLRSREDAERRLRDLDEMGIKGARVMTEERWRHAIALGTFVTEAGAAAHYQRMREAKVRNVTFAPRTDASRPAVVMISDPTPAIAARLVELRSAFVGTEVKAVTCR